ncbi:MAG: 4-hydroxybenzoate octaprenyltransferase, partial [Synechococcus sp.]
TGLLLKLSLTYYLALLVACLMWAWQTKKLHEPQPPRSIFPKIFRQNVTVGFVLLAGMISGSLL